jgi:hypothetical protein
MSRKYINGEFRGREPPITAYQGFVGQQGELWAFRAEQAAGEWDKPIRLGAPAMMDPANAQFLRNFWS